MTNVLTQSRYMRPTGFFEPQARDRLAAAQMRARLGGGTPAQQAADRWALAGQEGPGTPAYEHGAREVMGMRMDRAREQARMEGELQGIQQGAARDALGMGAHGGDGGFGDRHRRGMEGEMGPPGGLARPFLSVPRPPVRSRFTQLPRYARGGIIPAGTTAIVGDAPEPDRLGPDAELVRSAAPIEVIPMRGAQRMEMESFRGSRAMSNPQLTPQGASALAARRVLDTLSPEARAAAGPEPVMTAPPPAPPAPAAAGGMGRPGPPLADLGVPGMAARARAMGADLGAPGGQREFGRGNPTRPRGPAWLEDAMKDSTGSEKKDARKAWKLALGAQLQGAGLHLGEQARGAMGAFEAQQALRERMGLQPLGPEMEQKFYDAPLEKQMAMSAQMEMLTRKELMDQREEGLTARQDALTQDARAYAEGRTAEGRAYEEGRAAVESRARTQQDARRAASARKFTDVIFNGKPTGYAINDHGSLIHPGTGEPARLTPEQMDALVKDGWDVTVGDQGTTMRRRAAQPAKPKNVKITNKAGDIKDWPDDYETPEGWTRAVPKGQAAPPSARDVMSRYFGGGK